MDRAHLQTSHHLHDHRRAVSDKHPSRRPKNSSTSVPNHLRMQPRRPSVDRIVTQIQAEYDKILHVNLRLNALLQQRDKHIADIEELLRRQSGRLRATEERAWAMEQTCTRLEIEMASQNAVMHGVYGRER